MDAHHFNVNIDWKSGRTGEMTSPELSTLIEVATPRSFRMEWKESGRPNICSLLQLAAVS